MTPTSSTMIIRRKGTMRTDILELVDLIQEQSDFAEIDVMCSLCRSYVKSAMLIGETTQFTQESFKDDLKGPVLGTKDESAIKRIAMLIPRLIAKLVELVKRMIQKLRRSDSKIQKTSKEIDDLLDSARSLGPDEVQQLPNVDHRGHFGESYTYQEQPLPASTDTKDAKYLDSKYAKSNSDTYDKMRTWNPGEGTKIQGLYYNENFSYVTEFNRITKPLWDFFGPTKRMSMPSYKDVDDPKKLRELIDGYLPLTYDGKRVNWVITRKHPEAINASSDYHDFAKRYEGNPKTYDYNMNASQIKRLKDTIADSTSEKQLLKVLEVFEDDLQRMGAITSVSKELMKDHKHWLFDPIAWGQDKADLTKDLERVLRQLNTFVSSMSLGYTTFRRLREHDMEQIKKSLNTFTK